VVALSVKAFSGPVLEGDFYNVEGVAILYIHARQPVERIEAVTSAGCTTAIATTAVWFSITCYSTSCTSHWSCIYGTETPGFVYAFAKKRSLILCKRSG
jgi:hypothetical protein